MSISEQLIYCTTKIVSYLPNGNQSIGTGFFVNFNFNNEENTSQPVVSDNKHVVVGASKVEISICKADENNNPKDIEKNTTKMINLKNEKLTENQLQLCRTL